MAEPLLARIVRQGGGRLLNRTVDRLLPVVSKAVSTTKPKSSLTGALTGAALTRLATRSVPGALIVGGGMLAKMLYDRRRQVRDSDSGSETRAVDENDDDAIG